MRTRFTDLLGISVPVMQGGMSSVARAPLVAAVSEAGALGTLGAAVFAGDEAGLRAEIDAVRAATARPFAVNVPLFLGDLAWWLIEQLAAAGVTVVETAGRSPAPFVGALHDAGMLVVHKATRVRDVLSAQRAGADAVCLLGGEAAGHPGPEQVSSLVSGRLAADALDVPWLLGGGIADGAGLAAALALGADGVLVGTRFAATREASVHPAVHDRLIAASAADTVVVLGSVGDHARVLATDRARELAAAEAAGAAAAELHERYGDHLFRTVVTEGDLGAGVLACGQSVGLVGDVPTAAELVGRMVADARAAATRLAAAAAGA
ncbi:MAG: nitronate monooxygenase [Acidimicrobiales bacterium]|nr:nitronate monooxygenase [Acidimicrobiales bacterium]